MKTLARIGIGLAGAVLCGLGTIGMLIAVIATAETSPWWLFLVIPAALIVAVVMLRIGSTWIVTAADN